MSVEWTFALLSISLALLAPFVAARWVRQDDTQAEPLHPLWGLFCFPAVVFSVVKVTAPDISLAQRLSAGGFAVFAAVVGASILLLHRRRRDHGEAMGR